VSRGAAAADNAHAETSGDQHAGPLSFRARRGKRTVGGVSFSAAKLETRSICPRAQLNSRIIRALVTSGNVREINQTQQSIARAAFREITFDRRFITAVSRFNYYDA